MITGAQTGYGIPHDKYNICGIAHVRTNKKDDIFMKRRLYIDEAHTALDIFRFAVFLSMQYNCPGGVVGVIGGSPRDYKNNLSTQMNWY